MVRAVALSAALVGVLLSLIGAGPVLADPSNPQNFTDADAEDILQHCRPILPTARRKMVAAGRNIGSDAELEQWLFGPGDATRGNMRGWSQSDLVNRIAPMYADPRYAEGFNYEYLNCAIARRIWQFSNRGRYGSGAAAPRPGPPPAQPPAAPRPSVPPPQVVTSVPALTAPGLPAPGTPGARPVYPVHAAIAEGNASLGEALDDYSAAQAAGKPWEPPPLEEGEDATACLQLDPPDTPGAGASLRNTCSYRVEALWCVIGHDCRPYYSNMHTFGPAATYPIYGTSGAGSGRTVMWAACRGRNTIRGSESGFFHSCSKELK